MFEFSRKKNIQGVLVNYKVNFLRENSNDI